MRTARKNTIGKRLSGLLMALLMVFGMAQFAMPEAQAKTLSAQPAENVFFYVKNSAGEKVLLRIMTIEELHESLSHAQGLEPGDKDGDHYFVSYTDNLPTTCYRQGVGFTLDELAEYVQGTMGAPNLAGVDLAFAGEDKMGFIPTDSPEYAGKQWTYNALYGVDRYYFEGLYDYWTAAGFETNIGYSDDNYYDDSAEATPKYFTADKNAVFATGVPMKTVLMTESYSDRIIYLQDYINTHGGITGCLNGHLERKEFMSIGITQTAKTMRTGERTASTNTKWIYQVDLDMASDPGISAEAVAAPTCNVSVDGNIATITFACDTPGAVLYHNLVPDEDGYVYQSPAAGEHGSYQENFGVMYPYTKPIEIDISDLSSMNIRFRAVKEGCSDAGLQVFTYPKNAPAFPTGLQVPLGSDVVLSPSGTPGSEEWTAWTDAITGIGLRTGTSGPYAAIDAADYTIDDANQTITLDKDLFATTGVHSIQISADGYQDRVISRTLLGIAPAITAAPAYILGQAVTLTFDDPYETYGSTATVRVTPPGSSTSYPISNTYLERLAGSITIKENYMSYSSGRIKEPGNYILTIGNTSYTPSSQDVAITVIEPSDAYAVSVDEAITGGTVAVSPAAAAAGATVTVTVTPDSGKRLVEDSLKYTTDGGATYTPIAGNSFTMLEAAVTVTAQFEDVPAGTYAVRLDSTITGGTVAVNHATGDEGDTIAVTVTPAVGKRLTAGSLRYTTDGTTFKTITGNSFTMPAGDVTVTAQFENESVPTLTYSLSASADSINLGESVALTADLSSSLGSYTLYGAQYEVVLDAEVFTDINVAPVPGWQYDTSTAHGSTTVTFALLHAGGLAAGDSTPVGTITVIAARAGTHSIASGSAVATDAQGIAIPAVGAPAPVSIAVQSSDVYTVTVDDGITGGSVAVSPSTGAPNVPVTVTVTPDSGKQLAAGSLKYTVDDGETYTSITATEGVYRFLLPAANVIVTAAFEDLPALAYDIKKAALPDAIWTVEIDKTAASAGETVTVTVSDTAFTSWATGLIVTGDSGAEYEFTTITPATGNANDVNGPGVYSFVMPAEPVTVDFTADYTRLEVYVQMDGGAGPETLVHSYTRAEMVALAAQNTGDVYYSFWDRYPAPCVGKSEQYVTLAQLAESANGYNSALRFDDSDCTLKGFALDGYMSSLSWDYLIDTPRKFYPDIVSDYITYPDPTQAVDVEPVLAIVGYAGRGMNLGESIDNKVCDTLNTYRFFYGQSEFEYGDGTISGDTMEVGGVSRCTFSNSGKFLNKLVFVVPEPAPEDKTPPALTPDTTDNTLGQAAEITFTDDEAWRNAISGISVEGVTLDSGKYTIGNGVITIDQSVFTTAKDYAVIVSAAGYSDATVTQTIRTAATYAQGDVNGDGAVNILDVVQAVNFAIGETTPTTEQFNAADMNEDGSINILDVVQIVNKAMEN
ncbi:MAG TPA: hypothetical protein DCZ10_05115 [Pelotomaculum sp.]|nr:hypothetical protein [Pelotomaculum sp.]